MPKPPDLAPPITPCVRSLSSRTLAVLRLGRTVTQPVMPVCVYTVAAA